MQYVTYVSMFDLGLVFGCFTHLNVAAVVRSKFLKNSFD